MNRGPSFDHDLQVPAWADTLHFPDAERVAVPLGRGFEVDHWKSQHVTPRRSSRARHDAPRHPGPLGNPTSSRVGGRAVALVVFFRRIAASPHRLRPGTVPARPRIVNHEPVLRLGHLNLVVSDLDRSIVFYGRWFGFDRVVADYDDGTRFITDTTGFELGLHPGRPAASRPDWHFGFLSPDSDGVRDLMASLSAAGVPISDPEDEPNYVGFKCQDPDGYVIEVYWEPRP